MFYVIYGCFISLSWKIFGVDGREMQFWAIQTASSFTVVTTGVSVKSRVCHQKQVGLSNVGFLPDEYFLS